MGRPLEYTPAIGAEIVKLLEVGAFLETAAAAMGVGKNTIHDWMRRGRREPGTPLATFAADARKAMATAEIWDIRIIRAAAENGVWQAAAWRLERKWPDRYGQRGSEALIEEKVDRKLKKLLDQARKKTPKLKAVG